MRRHGRLWWGDVLRLSAFIVGDDDVDVLWIDHVKKLTGYEDPKGDIVWRDIDHRVVARTDAHTPEMNDLMEILARA